MVFTLRAALGLLVTFGSLLSPNMTAAQKEPEELADTDPAQRESAREAYAAGLTALEHGQLDLAIENFQLAQRLMPHAHTAVAIATVQERQGRTEEAIGTLEAFFDDPAARSPEVAAQIARLRAKRPATLMLTAPSTGWRVRVDGDELAGRTPTKIDVDPGQHNFELISPGGEHVRETTTVKAGGHYHLQVSNEAVDAEPNDDTNVAAWLFGGGAIAALGTGIGFGIAAMSAKSEYETSPTQSTFEDANDYALISDIAFAGAGAFAIATLVAIVADDDDERPQGSQPKLRIEPQAGSAHLGINARGTF